MSGIRRQRPSSAYVAYPGHILIPKVLDDLGVMPGTSVSAAGVQQILMSRADWDKVVAAIKAVKGSALRRADSPHRAILLTGRTWRDNPLIERPADEPDDVPPPVRKVNTGPFAYLLKLPVEEALALAKSEHEARMAAGTDEESSLETYMKAVQAIKRRARAGG